MRIVLERHAYAPELNKAHIGNGRHKATIPAPGCQSIREVRARLFAPITHRGRVVTIKVTYPTPLENLGRTYAGFCTKTAHLGDILRRLRAYHNLPGAHFAVSSRVHG